MRIINEESNPLIMGYKRSKGEAPMPHDYDSFESFLVAHRANLKKLRAQNNKDLRKIFHLVRTFHNSNGKSYMFAYLSKIIHFRKEFDAFLVRGIDSCTRHIERGAY